MLALALALAASAAPSAPTAPPLPRVELSIGPQLEMRRVTFHDRLTSSLAGYRGGAQPGLRVALAWAPAAGQGLPVVSDAALFASASRTLTSHTLSADGSLSLDTKTTRWELGARVRGVFDGEERGGLSLSYGALQSDFAGASLPGAVLPSGRIEYWRPGLDGRIALGAVELAAGLGYLLVARQNAIGDAFPRARTAGVDGRLSASLPLGVGLGTGALTLTARYLRFFSSLNPLPHDPFIAGGSLDEAASIDLAYSLRL